MQNPMDKLHELWKGFDSVVLITQTSPAIAHARPMAIAHVDDNCDLWFFTNEHTAKVREIESNARAQVIAQQGLTRCIIATGKAHLVRDRSKMFELWRPEFKVWFPEGVEDPCLVLIHFAGAQAEYWDNTGLNRFTYLHQALKAAVQGTRPAIRENEQHGTVPLAHYSDQAQTCSGGSSAGVE